MKNCNVVGAVIYLEELQNTLLSGKQYEAANLLGDAIKDIALARSEITTKASLAGSMTVGIYGNLDKEVTFSAVGSHSEMVKMHKHVQSGPADFIHNNPKDHKTKYINNLYNKLLKLSDKDPVLNGIQEGYWKTNVDEFIAVALSNPDMFLYLNSMRVSNNKSILHKMIKTLANMVGIPLDSEGEVTVDMFVQMLTAEIGLQNTSTNEEETPYTDNPFKDVGTAEQNNINDLFNKCKKG